MAAAVSEARQSVKNIISRFKSHTLQARGHINITTIERTSFSYAASENTFLALPTEIRLHIYEYYFASTRIGPKSHPRDRHGTAIFLVCKQLHEEALPILYRCATLTIDLDPIDHKKTPGFAHLLETYDGIGAYFKGDIAQVANFSNVHLTLPTPPPILRSRWLHSSPTYWQQVATLYYSTHEFYLSHNGAGASIAINLGDITAPRRSPLDLSFAEWASDPAYYAQEGWYDSVENGVGYLTPEQRKALPRCGWFRALAPVAREYSAMRTLIHWVGSIWHQTGRKLRVESADQTESVAITSDKLPDFVESVRAFVEGREDRSIWIELDSNKKKEIEAVTRA